MHSFRLPLMPLLCIFSLSILSGDLLYGQSEHPAVQNWRRNLDGTTGSSPAANIDAAVSQIEADVQGTWYDNDNAYVEATGIPSHPIGPFTGDGNPGVPDNQEHVWRIPLDPQPATNPIETRLGPIGFFANGVAMFNALDGRSYRNQGIWNRNAMYWEALGFDTGMGHPAMDFYHYHQRPDLLAGQRGDNETGRFHSPLIGFGFDGYPVYGSFGFSNANGTGGLRRMESGYQLRNLTSRQNGPPVNAQYPLGCFVEDFEYVGTGDLDEHNGRFCKTPEYPQGTYVYFSTTDASGETVYPYLIGPSWYGVPDLDNGGGGPPPPPGGPPPPPGGGIDIPPGATQYQPFELYCNNTIVGEDATIAVGSAESFSMVTVAYSLKGGGPINTPYGQVSLSFPVKVFPSFQVDADGFASLLVTIPTSAPSDVTVFYQAVSLKNGTSDLSLPGRFTIL